MVKPNSCWYYEVSTTAPQYAFHKLAKAVADMGFYEFRRQYKYKCQLYGSKLTIVDRWFPKRARLECSVKFSYGGQFDRDSLWTG